MTTSMHQRMTQTEPHSKVRRRLFAEDTAAEAACDNFVNALQDLIAIDTERMRKNWNFDPIKEVPLEGPIEWFRKDESNWIGKMKSELTVVDDEKLAMDNEVTPRVTKEGPVPLVRKRRREVDSGPNDSSARRKISFD